MMATDTFAQQLHHKATLGKELSAEEKAHLEAWYARLDQEESAILLANAPAPLTAALQAQLDALTAQILTVTQDIQSLSAENQAILREVASLQRRLVQRSGPQPA